MKFFYKYTFLKLFSILIILFTLLLATYLQNVYDKLEQKYQLNATMHNKLQYSIIERNLLNTKKDIIYIRSMFEYFNNNNEYNLQNKVDLFTATIERLMISKKLYSQIRYLDTKGNELIRVDYKGSTCKVVNSSSLQNKFNRDYFQDSLTLKPNEIYLSAFDLNKENSKVEIPYNPTIRLATPVTNKESVIVGYIIINYLGKEILNDISKHNDDIGTILLNKESYYLLGFNKEDEWGFMFDNGINFKTSFPKLWKKIDKTSELSIAYKNRQYSFLSINPVDIVSPKRATQSRRLWVIVTYVNDEVILKQFYSYLDSIKILIVTIILTLMALSILISMYFKRVKEEDIRKNIADEVFNNSIEGILVLNEKAEIVQVNRAFTTITGYDEKDVLNINPRILKGSLGESKEYYENMWDSIINSGSFSGELVNQKKDGTKYVSQLSIGVVKRDNKILYYIGVFSDISRQREDKEKLIKSTTALQNSLEELKSTQEKLVESEKLTALGELIAGVSHEINSPLGAIKSSSDNAIDTLEKVLQEIPKLEKILSSHEMILFEKLKSSMPIQNSILSIKEQRTLKKKLKEQLDSMGVEQSRYFADKFAQFNIEDIAQYRDLILHSDAKFIIDTLFNEYSTISNMYNIKRSVDRASKTIFALKKFAHFDHDREGVVEKLEDSIETILVLFNHNLKQGIEVVKEYKSLEPIFCYSDELAQIWMNLISNAIHAMNNQGTLTISINEDEQYQIISIKDSGCGIPKDIQNKIFEPFFTTKKSGEGSGLGLDIVKKIVDAHKGKINVHSNEHGTTFTIYISKNIK